MNKQTPPKASNQNKEFKQSGIKRYIRADFKTLQGRITIGFLLIGLFAIIMLLSSHFMWSSQLQKSKELIFYNKNSATKVAEIQQMADLTTILAFRYVSTQDEFFTNDIQNRWNNNISPLLEDVDSLTALIGNEEINVFVTKLGEHLPKIRNQQQQALNENTFDALNTDQIISDIIHLTFLTTKIKEKLNDLEKKTLQEIKDTEKKIYYILGIEFIISLIISSLIALYTIQSVLQRIKFLKIRIREMSEGKLPDPLAHSEDELNSIIKALNELILNLKGITHFAEEVGKGQFDTDITVFDNKGHLGESLAEMRTKLQNVAEQDKRRVWFNEGIAKFGDILRKNNASIEDLSSKLIAELVGYTNSNQGSLFVASKEEGKSVKLVLKGAYAYERQKFIEKEIAPGQGLVGQAYLEKEPILLSEIPSEYIAIKSGLGEAPPSYILISPMKLNEDIFGIIELASFHPFEPYHIEFVEKVGESIASTIQGLQISIETRLLLEESQMKAEQLQAQEEEMRQNAEELEATQEEMERQHRESLEQNEKLNQQDEELKQNMEELSAQNEEIENQMHKMKEVQSEMDARQNILNESTIISEADLNGTITYVNDKLIQVSKYSREEMIGKGHNLFRHEDMPKEIFQEMWATIKVGKVFRGIIKNKAKDNSIYWVDATIAPVIDESGNPFKYIGVRYVIEQEDIAVDLYNRQLKSMGLV